MHPRLVRRTHAFAGPNKDYPNIDDTSFTEPNGDRVIRLSVEAAAPSEDVWRALTTADGWKSFSVAFAVVDMKVGGIIETSYNPKAQPGDPDNIKNEIVAYVPGRILAIRCVQAPRNFVHKPEFFATSTLMELVPHGKDKTLVTLTAVGYRPGEAYDDLLKKFQWGDAYTLDKLRQRFEPHPASPGGNTEPKTSTR
jgi:uncharacterized protein YndB with AHSA1/START domain